MGNASPAAFVDPHPQGQRAVVSREQLQAMLLFEAVSAVVVPVPSRICLPMIARNWASIVLNAGTLLQIANVPVPAA